MKNYIKIIVFTVGAALVVTFGVFLYFEYITYNYSSSYCEKGCTHPSFISRVIRDIWTFLNLALSAFFLIPAFAQALIIAILVNKFVLQEKVPQLAKAINQENPIKQIKEINHKKSTKNRNHFS